MSKLNFKRKTEIILISIIVFLFIVFISIESVKYFSKNKDNINVSAQTTPTSNNVSFTAEVKTTPVPSVTTTNISTIEVTPTPTSTSTSTSTPFVTPTNTPTPTPVESKPTEAERTEFLSELKRLYKAKDYLAVLEHVNNGLLGKFKNEKDIFEKVKDDYIYSLSIGADYYVFEGNVQKTIDLYETARFLYNYDLQLIPSLLVYYGMIQEVKSSEIATMRWTPNSNNIYDGGILEADVVIYNNSDKVLKSCKVSIAHYMEEGKICDINNNPNTYIEGEPYVHYQTIELDLNLQPGETYTLTKVIHDVDKISESANIRYYPRNCKALACVESYSLSDGIKVSSKLHSYWYRLYVNNDQIWIRYDW